jgi:hypothetical protein
MKPNPSEPVVTAKKPIRISILKGLLKGLFISIVILAILDLNLPGGARCRKRPDQTEAVNNARQIGIALFEFEAEYGRFPDESTIAKVREKTGSALRLGARTSNDCFRQLLAAGIAQSESIFYAKASGAHKPDGYFEGTKALEKGEVGFAYLSGLRSDGNPSQPLIVAPLIPGTDRFDPKPFEGKAVILKMDNSVTSMIIGKDGHVKVDGKNLLDPGNPVWNGHPPVIAWSDL